MRNPALLGTITGHEASVTFVRFSPDGRVLATAGRDRTVRLWNVADPRRWSPMAKLTGHEDTVISVAFSPNGHLLASGSYDHTVRLWDIGDPRHPSQLATLTGHDGLVGSVAWSPNGQTLASAGNDRTAQLWDTDFQRVIDHACDRAHPTITRAEWDRYFPGVAYQPPCGG